MAATSPKDQLVGFCFQNLMVPPIACSSEPPESNRGIFLFSKEETTVILILGQIFFFSLSNWNLVKAVKTKFMKRHEHNLVFINGDRNSLYV